MNCSTSAPNGSMGVVRGAAIHDLRAPGVPGGEVAQRAHAIVLVLDLVASPGRAGRVAAIRRRTWMDGFSSAQAT